MYRFGPATSLSLSLLLALWATPAEARARGRQKVSLLPLELVNVPAERGTGYRRLLVRELRTRPTLEVVPLRGVAVPSDCGASIDCLKEVGLKLAVAKLLLLRVGLLGDTTVVRLTAFDVERGARQGTWQEVLRRTSDRTTRQALERLVNGFAPRPPPPPPPPKRGWYTRWWVWTIAGVVVAGTVTAVVLATRDRPHEIITPP